MISLLTVTHNEYVYIERFFRMLDEYVDIECQHLVFDMNSDLEFLSILAEHLSTRNPKIHRILVRNNTNLWDMPAYNRLLQYRAKELAIALSPDTRIQAGAISKCVDNWKSEYGIMGPNGGMGDLTPHHADPEIGGEWHWVPRLLVERGVPFDNCGHIQTYAFMTSRGAWERSGGFWEPEDGVITGKGDLIAAEVSYSDRLRKAGYKPYAPSWWGQFFHHYGNQALSEEDLIKEDAIRGFEPI